VTKNHTVSSVLELPGFGVEPPPLPPQFMSTDAHFWVKIGFKFQSMCKISNMSTSDPPVLLGQFQHWLLVENDCVTHAVRYCGSCKDYQNLNSFFAVVMGLSNIAVSRLSQTWEVQFVGCLAPPVYTCLLEIISYELHVNPWRPYCHMGTAIKHPVPDCHLWFLTSGHSDARSALSVRVPGCQKLQMTA